MGAISNAYDTRARIGERVANGAQQTRQRVLNSPLAFTGIGLIAAGQSLGIEGAARLDSTISRGIAQGIRAIF